MDTNLRHSGIDGLGDMVWGTHFCLFYETKEDLLDILMPYLKTGLENNEFFLCVASPPLSTEEAQWAMQEAVPDFEQYLAEGQIEIVSYRDWLLTGGQLDTQRVLQNWIAKLNWALAKGYAGLRFAGDPSWLDKQAWGGVPEFEKQLDQIVGNSQMLGCALMPWSAVRQETYSTLSITINLRWPSGMGFGSDSRGRNSSTRTPKSGN
jgi:hypothetical protein